MRSEGRKEYGDREAEGVPGKLGGNGALEKTEPAFEIVPRHRHSVSFGKQGEGGQRTRLPFGCAIPVST